MKKAGKIPSMLLESLVEIEIKTRKSFLLQHVYNNE